MATETKVNGSALETNVSKGLKSKFKSRCKKLNVSMAQRLRDLIQRDVKVTS